MPFDLSWITPEIESVQAMHAARFAALLAGEPMDVVPTIAGPVYGSSHGLWGTNLIDPLQEPEAWLADVLGQMAEHAQEYADPVTFRPLAIEVDPLGVHFMDAILGARVHFHSGQVWADQLGCDLMDLQSPDLAGSEVLQRALALERLVVEATQGRILITTPVLSCAINVGMSLFGQRLPLAMAERPEAAAHALGVINDTILDCARLLADVIPETVRRSSVTCNRYMPSGFGFLDGCATQLVSAHHYREYLAPLDEAVLSAAPLGGMIHLCGAHVQHIPAWRDMPKLRAVQLNDRATEDLELYFEGLRDDQVLYVSPTTTTTQDAVLAVTGGRRLVLQVATDEPVTVP